MKANWFLLDRFALFCLLLAMARPLLTQQPVSQNMAIRAGDTAIVLKTSRLAAAESLPPSTLANQATLRIVD